MYLCTVFAQLPGEQDVSAGVFDEFWEKLILGPPYVVLANLAAMIAVFAIALWTLNIISQRQDGDRGPIDVTYLGRFVLIIVLLAHQGDQSPLLATMTYQTHKAGNGMVAMYYQGVKKSLGCGIDRKSCDPTDMAAAKAGAIALVEDALRICPTRPNKEVQNDCFLGAQKEIHRVLDPYIQRLGGDNWANKLGRNLDAKIAEAMGGDYGNYDFWRRVAGGLAGSFGGISQAAISAWLFAVSAAIQFGIGIAAIVVASAGPFVLAFSLADLEKVAPLKGWFSGFVGLYTIKLAYGVIVVMTSYASLQSTADSSYLIYPIVLAIIGPLIALLAGTANGVLIFAGLSRLASGGAAYLMIPKR